MTHTFLLQPGNWSVNGHWLHHNENPIPLSGHSMVTWKQEQWFSIVTRLTIGDGTEWEIHCKYKGHLDREGKYYTYVLRHNIWGHIEGEGWIGPQTIIQYYWVLGASQRHNGFDTYFCLTEDIYHFSSGIITGHNLNSTMEATFKRQF